MSITFDSLSSTLLALTRTANRLGEDDVEFHRSLDFQLGEDLDAQNKRLISLAEKLLNSATVGSEEEVRRGPKLTDLDGLDENWNGVVDVLDSLLERADSSLDEYSGLVKRLSPSRDNIGSYSPRPSKFSTFTKSHEIVKPQLSFDSVSTNQEKAPFYPLITHKPHSLLSLDKSINVVQGEDGLERTTHPYQTEIDEYQYPNFVYTKADPISYNPFESTTATFVDTEEALDQMLEELKEAKEIAIDLEHHDYRSYIGLVSLMQISTRNKDWIVDTLKPWRRKLQILNQVFADPSILKVLHGAHMDIVWLQRDLGLYIVGLFDTHHAARVLGYSGGSLAFLLKKFVDFDAKKQYQMADWRIRPLPTEMFDYARSDTHFLLYIYDNMRNELIDNSNLNLGDEGDKLHDVLERSKETALQVYNHPVYDAGMGLGPAGWYKLLIKHPSSLTKEQFCVFRRVHQWRDRVAREQDDSVHFILSNGNLFGIAKEMPTEQVALFGMVQPITSTVRSRIDELLAVIRKAKETSVKEKEMREVMREIEIHLYGEPMSDVISTSNPLVTTKQPEIIHSVTTIPTTSPKSITSVISSFWGRILPSNQKREYSTFQPHFSIPLPPAEIQSDVSPPPSSPLVPQNTASSLEKKQDKDEIFTLRSLNSPDSTKRKSEVLETEDDLTSDIINLPSAMTEKAKRKAEKKAAKRAKKAHEDVVADDVSLINPNGEPDIDVSAKSSENHVEEFDYANAPSVLNASRDAAIKEREEMKARKEKERKERREKKGTHNDQKDNKTKSVEAFSFAKGLGDVKHGLGRVQRESAGKSKTFKSL